MPLTRAEQRALLEKGVVNDIKLAEINATLKSLGATTVLTMQNVLIFLGGLMAIGSISIWYTLTKRITGWEIMWLAIGLGTLALFLTHFFLKKAQDSAASVTATFAVFTVTLATYGYQMATGTLPEGSTMVGFHQVIGARWLPMELATIAAGVILLAIYRLPFITMPIAVAIWYMSMDLAPLIADYLYAKPADADRYETYQKVWELRKWVSVYVGLATIVIAFVVDISTKGVRDFAFWPYLAGLLAFWGGLTAMGGGTELTKAVYAGINLILLFMGPLLMRKVFIVAGGAGLFLYCGEQALKRFVDNPDFFVLALVAAAAIIVLGLVWGRYASVIEKQLSWMAPQKLRDRWAV